MFASSLPLFDETRHARQLHSQRHHRWDLESRLDWRTGVDLTKPLLPLDRDNLLFPDANPEQRLVISQLMGLIVAATVSQLEGVAVDLKGPAWEHILDRHPVNPEFYALGEAFYEEEAKHSRAFSRYLDVFSTAVGVDPKDFRQFLPRAEGRSLSKQIYRWNSLLGGRAVWWLIAAFEEESILLHRYLQPFEGQIDPLYYQLHRAHFEEEARHRSYALMMLQHLDEFGRPGSRHLFKKIDFLVAECLNLTWTFRQLLKIKGLRKFRGHHPFFVTLESLWPQLADRRLPDVLNCLLNSAPYISNTLRLGEYPHINAFLLRYRSLRLPWKPRPQGELCIR